MIWLRKATMDDADFILRLKNDPVSRRFAIVSHEEISPDVHHAWLRQKLNAPLTCLSIIMFDGLPVGDVRLEGGAETEISIRIVPEYRNQGISTEVIGIITAPIAQAWKSNVIAKIVDGNIASQKLFKRCGFLESVKMQGYSIYTYVDAA